MGILSQTVRVYPRGKSIAYYQARGYDTKYGQELEVKVEDLPICSTTLIEVECDYCKTPKFIKYVDYNAQTKNGTRKCCCLNCVPLKRGDAMFERYGDRNPNRIPEFVEKRNKTNLERYGSISPSGNLIVRQKQRDTLLNNYGVENPSLSKEIQQKREQTFINKYGVENPLLVPEIREKAKQTNIERYGVENVFCKGEIRDKRDATLIERYGTAYPLQNQECYEKFKQTNFERYGVEYIPQAKEIREKVKQTNLNRYGVECVSQCNKVKEKIKQTNLEKYGVESLLSLPEFHEHSREVDMERYGVYHHLQNPEILAKQKETFYKNGICIVSKQQNHLYNLYKSIDNSATLNFPISHYNADICLLADKTVIEYNGSGHDLTVKRGSMTQEEFNKKEMVRFYILKREGYKQMIIISSKDKLPSDQVLLDLLSYARNYFLTYPQHSWIEFNIDTSSVRSAEYKDGIFFDYGELRKISKVV